MSVSDEEYEHEYRSEMRQLFERQASALERIATRIEEVGEREKAEHERRANRARPSVAQKINTLFMEALRAAEHCDDKALSMEDVHPSNLVTPTTDTEGGACVGHYVFNALMNLHTRVHAVLSGEPLPPT